MKGELELRAFGDGLDEDRMRKLKGDAQADGVSDGPGLCSQAGTRCNQSIRRCFTVKTLRRRLPILTWLPKYSLTDLEGDIVAGVTVALTVIPQGLALAVLAGLPPQYGLYTAFMGCFMYTIFGSCKDLTIGPTAIMSLMTHEHVHLRGAVGGPVYAILLTFFSGLIQLAMGFLNLGFLVNFISGPVISGFTSAAAITIAVTQLKSLFGLKYNAEGFIPTVKEFFLHIHETKYYDMAMGLSSVVILLLIRHFKDKKFPENSMLPVHLRKMLERCWFMFATGRNAIVVLVCAGIAAIMLQNNMPYLTLTTGVQGGLPNFTFPKFSYEVNGTNGTETRGIVEIVSDIGSGLIIIPLLSILEAIAIAKAFAKGKKLDATQELIALGVCNFMGAFVSAYPTTGSFSRTAINNSSGVRTTLSGLFTGAIVLLALGALAPYFKYLPSSSLAAIIFVSVIFMVHYQDVPLIWRTKKWDLVPLLATFIGSFVLGLEFGILIGVGLSFVFLLFQEARPTVEIALKTTAEGVTYLYVCPDRSVFFPSIEYMKTKINKGLPDDIQNFCVLFDGSNITTADYTMALGIKNMIDSYKKDNIITIFINCQENVQRSFQGTRPSIYNYCHTMEEAAQIINHTSRKLPSMENGTVKVDLISNEGSANGVRSLGARNNSFTANGITANESRPDGNVSNGTINEVPVPQSSTPKNDGVSVYTVSPLLQENNTVIQEGETPNEISSHKL